MTERPIIAMTMGDAAGVGPEVIMKSLAHAELHAQCRPLVIGDAERLREAGRIVGSALEVRSLSVDEIDEARFQQGTVDCIDLKLIPKELPWGKLSAFAGDAAYRYVEVAARLALNRQSGRNLHRAAEQGSTSGRRALLSRPYRIARRLDRH